MEFKQIRKRKIYEEVADQLKEMIVKGELQPGEKLASAKELAEKFNVGRSAVREALSALKAIGLLEMHQGEGTYVRRFDPKAVSGSMAAAVLVNQQQLFDLLEVRKIIEAGSATLCALRRDERDLATMDKSLREMEESLGQSESLGERADMKFHLAIAHGSKNELLIQLMNTISDLMQKWMRESRRIWLYAEEETAERLYQDHLGIYEAIRDQNSSLARERMLAHLNKVESVLRHFIENSRGNGSSDPYPQ